MWTYKNGTYYFDNGEIRLTLKASPRFRGNVEVLGQRICATLHATLPDPLTGPAIPGIPADADTQAFSSSPPAPAPAGAESSYKGAESSYKGAESSYKGAESLPPVDLSAGRTRILDEQDRLDAERRHGGHYRLTHDRRTILPVTHRSPDGTLYAHLHAPAPHLGGRVVNWGIYRASDGERLLYSSDLHSGTRQDFFRALDHAHACIRAAGCTEEVK